jgi:hypothetical protein
MPFHRWDLVNHSQTTVDEIMWEHEEKNCCWEVQYRRWNVQIKKQLQYLKVKLVEGKLLESRDDVANYNWSVLIYMWFLKVKLYIGPHRTL